MLRVLRLAVDEPLQHIGGLRELPARDVRLGQQIHRREDVRLFVEARVERDDALERRRVALIDAQHAIEHLHCLPAFAAAEGTLHEGYEHFEGAVRIVLFEVEIGERIADRRLVRLRFESALECGARGGESRLFR